MDKSLHIYLEWLLNKVTAPNTGKDAKKLGLSYIDGTMQNGTATLENNLAVCHKGKHLLTI